MFFFHQTSIFPTGWLGFQGLEAGKVDAGDFGGWLAPFNLDKDCETPFISLGFMGHTL